MFSFPSSLQNVCISKRRKRYFRLGSVKFYAVIVLAIWVALLFYLQENLTFQRSDNRGVSAFKYILGIQRWTYIVVFGWGGCECIELDAVHPLCPPWTRAKSLLISIWWQYLLSCLQRNTSRYRVACLVWWSIRDVSWSTYASTPFEPGFHG